MISKIINANGKRYSVVDLKGETIPGNTGSRDNEYYAVLAEEPQIWYELKKELLDARVDLPYLKEKLRMDESTGRDFIRQFNDLLD